jgi:hypothetical protein
LPELILREEFHLSVFVPDHSDEPEDDEDDPISKVLDSPAFQTQLLQGEQKDDAASRTRQEHNLTRHHRLPVIIPKPRPSSPKPFYVTGYESGCSTRRHSWG